MKRFFVVVDGYDVVVDDVEGEAAFEEAKELAKNLARKRKERVFVLAVAGIAEPIKSPIRWRSLR